MPARPDGRAHDALRPVTIDTGVQRHAEGSALVRFGGTEVLCAASVEASVPRWLRGAGRGWVTAEYAMLPRATTERNRRERDGARGRTKEIERLVGRSLRAAVDLTKLGERVVTVDCDVLQADGGTRTAAITGGWVALALALDTLVERGDLLGPLPLERVAAVSVGVVDAVVVLDLCYAEDVVAQTDMNVVVAGDGRFVEVQGTAEAAPFSRAELDGMLDLAVAGCATLFDVQAKAAGRA